MRWSVVFLAGVLVLGCFKRKEPDGEEQGVGTVVSDSAKILGKLLTGGIG